MRFKNLEKRSKTILISGDAPRFDGNTFSVRTEPGVQATKLPEAIPLVGRECKYVDAKYNGDMNLADNTVTVAAMDQEGTEWRKVDCISMKLRFNYLGLGLRRQTRNRAYNEQFRITQEQAISSAYASQMTELEFMGHHTISSIPEMEGAHFISDADVATNNELTGSGQFAESIWYQSFMQNDALVMTKYNTILSFADYLLKMGYNAESALILRYMNILKKQNVWTVFDQLGNLLNSQFFDLSFFNEITSINTIPCRKEDSVGSPLISLSGSVNMPGLAVFPSNGPQSAVIDWNIDPTSTDYSHWKKQLGAALNDTGFRPPVIFTIAPPTGASWEAYVTTEMANLGTVDATRVKANAKVLDRKVERYMAVVADENDTPQTYTYQELVEKICDELSFDNILKWARELYFAGSNATAEAASKVNHLIRLVGAMVNITSHFRSDTVDFITFMKVLQNSTSMNNWVLDTPYVHPAMPRRQVVPVYFKLIYDILTSYGTSGEMVLDEQTRGWDIFTWWHTEEGIPKYDAYEGGFTLAASIRGIPAATGATYKEPQYMIPTLFEIVDGTINFLNRRGKVRALTSASINAAAFAADPIFAGGQLMALPASINIPVLDFGSEIGVDKRDYSQAIRCITSLFGIGRIKLSSQDSGTVISFMDNKMEGLVGRTFSNANTMALNYINQRAPFRITTGAGATLGFMTG